MMSLSHRRRLTVAVLFLIVFGNCAIFQQQATAEAASITTTTTTITAATATIPTTATPPKLPSEAGTTSVNATTSTITSTSTSTSTSTTITTKTTSTRGARSGEIGKNAESLEDLESSEGELLADSGDAGHASIAPTTYRPQRPSIAPHTSAQERERRLMNVLAARRSALHRGGFRPRASTTGRSAVATSSPTAKSPASVAAATDPLSICTLNCTKNFMRRNTASCMRQCTRSLANATATATSTTPHSSPSTVVFVKASSKTGLGTQAGDTRDTNEILFTDESSHGLFVVAKDQNDTLNHIPEGGLKGSGGVGAGGGGPNDPLGGAVDKAYKFRSRGKPHVVVATAAPPQAPAMSVEDDEIAPYLYFGQKLPPLRPATLTITSVSEDHPRLLEVSVASTTTEAAPTPAPTPLPTRTSNPAVPTSTLSAVERSRSRYKYNMRDRGNVAFSRRFGVGLGAVGGVSGPRASVAQPQPLSEELRMTAGAEAGATGGDPPRREAALALGLGRGPAAPRPLAVVVSEPPTPTSTPLLITVLSDEEEATEATPSARPPATAATTTRRPRPVTTTSTTTAVPTTTTTTTTTTPTTTTTTTTSTTTTEKPTTSPSSTTTSAMPTTPSTTAAPATTTPTASTTTTSTMRPTAAPAPAPTTTTTTTTSTTSTTSPPPPRTKSIIEEDTERLRALGPSLTQEINTDEKTNLIIFINRTTSSGAQPWPTERPRGGGVTTDSSATILRTTVLSSVRSTVHPRTSTGRPAPWFDSEAEAEPSSTTTTTATKSTSTSTSTTTTTTTSPTSSMASDISSTMVAEEREVTIEMRRMNMATYVLAGIAIFPLVAVIVYVTRTFLLRRGAKDDEVFDVCIADQQPISPVKKLDSKFHKGRDRARDDDEEDDDDGDEHGRGEADEVDHRHHQQQQQKQPPHSHHNLHLKKNHQLHQNLGHHALHQLHQLPRDGNYNLNNNNNIINMKNNNNNSSSNGNGNNSSRYDEQCSVTSDQEFDRSNIRLKSLLGEGNFGQVWKAEADDLSGHFGATRIVAVKTVRACSAQTGLKDEANIMRKLGSHPNVVTLLGACVESEPHMLIMEYAMRGRLLSLLRAARSATNILPASVPGGRSLAPLSPRTLAGFALDIACGMEYIAERRIVHRDLAARNVLLDHNGVCKICDFGMSIDLDDERTSPSSSSTSSKTRAAKRKEEEATAASNEIMRSNSHKFKFDFGGRFIMSHWNNSFGNHNNSGGANHQQQQQHKDSSDKKSHGHGHGHDTISRRPALPIRWMAPEALQYHVFTSETDVWAFGIVLWEIATLGSTPYSHLTGREVIRSVANGLRPELPKEGRHEFYNLMARCWHKEPHLRPTFKQARLEISRSLGKWVEDDATSASDYMDVSGFSEDLEHGMVYFNHRISEFECEI